jgi:hypothetical protein
MYARIGKDRDENCRFCLEDATFYVFMLGYRLNHFEKGFLSPIEVKVLNSRNILGFLRATQLKNVWEQYRDFIKDFLSR